DQTIADKALEESEQQYISTKEHYEKLQSELAGSQIQVASLEREWQVLATRHTFEEGQLRTTLLTTLNNLQSDLAQWKNRYLLSAPQGGVVSFTDFLTKQKFVSQGEEILHILPIYDDSLSIVGQLKVPVQNSGKLAIGQRVDVYLENYPEAEFGGLSGVVHRISALPKQGEYRVIITFPKGLITQYGYHIPFQQHLQGSAEIITKDLRLLERLIYQLRTYTSNNAS
ncbi:MAG: HlyD family secretion protein, partial [Tunicatimonas sp.]|uniref:HlyD family efflux transporter periplasmic adaptor subunit n=1 Tax=Tunicatimonas sp. TaxID=1940096 RepID=UPI003C74A815